MGRLGNIAEIQAVKRRLASLTEMGLVKHWELPYENTLTRLTAAVFCLTLDVNATQGAIIDALQDCGRPQLRPNTERILSQSDLYLEFKES